MEGLGLSVRGALTRDGRGRRARDPLASRLGARRRRRTAPGSCCCTRPPLAGAAARRCAHPDGTTTAMRVPRRHQPASARVRHRRARVDASTASTRGSRSRATSSRWRTSATGRTPRSRRTAGRCRCPSRTRSPRARCSSRPLAVERDARPDAARDRARARIGSSSSRRGAFPSIGVAASTAPDPASRLAAPEPASGAAFVLVELDLGDDELARGARAGRAIRAPARRAGRRGSRRAISHAVVDALARGCRWRGSASTTALDSITLPGAAATPARGAGAKRVSRSRSIGGARSHFTELNRGRGRIPGDLDGLTFSVTPLFHTLDTEQLVESIAMQRLVAEQAVRHGRRTRRVHIGPVTLRPRFNNVATVRSPRPTPPISPRATAPRSPARDDPRIDAPELAAWTVASAAALAVPGVATLCYFEEWGPRGIRDPTAAPARSPRCSAGCRSSSGAALLGGESPDGQLWALGARHERGTTVLAANIGRGDRELRVWTPAGEVSLRLGSGEADAWSSRRPREAEGPQDRISASASRARHGTRAPPG